MSAATPAVGSGKVSTYEAAAQHPIQAIQWGASADVAYNAAGGGLSTGGPYGALLVRLAVSVGSGTGIRVAFGPSIAAAEAACSPGVLIPGSAIEFTNIPYGSYVAVISNDTNAGNLNVTLAL